MTASRLTYLVAFDTSLVVALLVALLTPERAHHLLGLGVCVALLTSYVEHVEQIRTGAGGDATRSPCSPSHAHRIRDVLDSGQPALLGGASVLVLLLREQPVAVVVVSGLAVAVAFAVERSARRRRPGPWTPPTPRETWRIRRPHRAVDLTYGLLIVTMGAFVVALPDDTAPVAAAASGAVAVLLVAARAERSTRRRPAVAAAASGTEAG